MSEVETFDLFEERVMTWGGTMYDGIPDDDDPMGHCMVVGEDGGITMMAIDGGMLAPENLKALVLGVCKSIADTKAKQIAWLLSAYKIPEERRDEGPLLPNFADDPRAIEVFRCICLEHDRASEHEAPILRSPSRLGKWEERKAEKGPYTLLPMRALALVADGRL